MDFIEFKWKRVYPGPHRIWTELGLGQHWESIIVRKPFTFHSRLWERWEKHYKSFIAVNGFYFSSVELAISKGQNKWIKFTIIIKVNREIYYRMEWIIHDLWCKFKCGVSFTQTIHHIENSKVNVDLWLTCSYIWFSVFFMNNL